MNIIIQLFKLIFGDRDGFRIFSNDKYDGDLSVEHRGGYCYINPKEFGGAGISFDRSQCAAFANIKQAKDFIDRWKREYYPKWYHVNPSIELISSGAMYNLYCTTDSKEASKFASFVGAQSITHSVGRIEILVLKNGGY